MENVVGKPEIHNMFEWGNFANIHSIQFLKETLIKNGINWEEADNDMENLLKMKNSVESYLNDGKTIQIQFINEDSIEELIAEIQAVEKTVKQSMIPFLQSVMNKIGQAEGANLTEEDIIQLSYERLDKYGGTSWRLKREMIYQCQTWIAKLTRGEKDSE